jgi:hypothetical protein
MMPDAFTDFALGEVFGQQTEKMRQSAALLGGDVHGPMLVRRNGGYNC